MDIDNRKKILLIVNPKAGKMAIKTELFRIIQLFSNSGYETCVYTTTKRGDATELTVKLAHRFDRIVCCGGDGTLNEVVTGTMQLETPIPIGFIPAGTTNDLADTFKIPKIPTKAAQIIIDYPPTPNDVGCFNNSRYFNYVASCGAFTSASYSTSQVMKNSLGHMAYVLEGIKDLTKIKPIHMQIDCRELHTEGDFIFAAVTNSLSVGGIYNLSPKYVNLNDGTFEVLLIRNPKNSAELVDIFYRLSNLDYDKKQVQFFHTGNLNILCDKPVKWTVDGEYAGEYKSINIRNIPGAVKIYKPPYAVQE